MIQINKIHHIAIICSNYVESKYFYTKILGLKIIQEVYRKERHSYKLDLALNDNMCIELFSFPDTPTRITNPEACGLRHLAFEVNSVIETMKYLSTKNIPYEPSKTDPYTNKKYIFIKDPDGLPIEFYER